MNSRHESYFYFSRKERNALIILVIFIALIIVVSRIIFYYQSRNALAELKFPEVKEWVKLPTEKFQHKFEKRSEIKETEYPRKEVFHFNPNTVGSDEMHKLGFSDKLISTINNYRNKGGKFRTADDLDKIWGMPASLAKELKPYVRIEKEEYKFNFTSNSSPSQKKNKVVEINSADSLDLLGLPGIGPVLSSRIIRFREKLGGFISINQVGETFGLPDSSFQKIKPFLKLSTGTIKKINLNLADLDELKKHPYIRFNLAKLIISYRQQHGPFHQISDLKGIMVLEDSSFQRIQPYLTVN